MKNETTLPANIADALQRVLDYLLDDEAADYMETSPLEDREGHIYVAIRLLDDWLAQRKPPSD